MRRLQHVLVELETNYIGHPYFVPGLAISNALARRLDSTARDTLEVSMGVFVPGAPGAHWGANPRSGDTGLPVIETYEDLFRFRDAAHRWLSESCHRDARNTHAQTNYGERTAHVATQHTDSPLESTQSWYVHWYVHAEDTDLLPLAEENLHGLHLGGGSNYGFGRTSLRDTQLVDLDILEYGHLKQAEAYRVELLTPYIHEPEAGTAQKVPSWWSPNGPLRDWTTERHTRRTIDHGQLVEYTGDSPIRTAKSGVLRAGKQTNYGYGEFRLRPADEDRAQQAARTPHRGDA